MKKEHIKIEGYKGLYCDDCVKEIQKEVFLKHLYTFIIILSLIGIIISLIIIIKCI